MNTSASDQAIEKGAEPSAVAFRIRWLGNERAERVGHHERDIICLSGRADLINVVSVHLEESFELLLQPTETASRLSTAVVRNAN